MASKVQFAAETRVTIESHARRSRDEKHVFGYLVGYHHRNGEGLNVIGAAKCKQYQEPRPSRLAPPKASDCSDRQSLPNWNAELFGEDQFEPGIIVSIPPGLSIVGVYFTYTATDTEHGDSSRYISHVCNNIDEYLKEEIDSTSAQLLRSIFLNRNSQDEITSFVIYPIDVSSAASTEERKDVFLAGISASSGYRSDDTRLITPDWVPLEKLTNEMAQNFAVLEVPVDFEISFEYMKSTKPGKDHELQNQIRKTQALRNKCIEIIKWIRWSPQNEAFFMHSKTGHLIHPSESTLAKESLKIKDLFVTPEAVASTPAASQSSQKQKKPAKAAAKGKKQAGKKKGGAKKRNVNAQIDIDALLEEEELQEEANQAAEANEKLNMTGCEHFTELELLHLPTPPTAAMESVVNLPFAGSLEFVSTHGYHEDEEADEELYIVKNAFVFSIDAICYVDLNAKASEGADLLLDSISGQILSSSVEKAISDPKDKFVFYRHPAMFHFKVKQCPHIITCIFPQRYSADGEKLIVEKNEDYLEPYRLAAHDRFFLPLNQPLLRKANSISILNVIEQQKKEEELKKNKTRLSNVHVGLAKLLPSAAKLHLVEGTYDYYHYRQDDMDDDGWGCAYRSLQTIISWFIIQGYAPGAKVPTHSEIQKALFELNDKPRTFVGSKEWIGAFEVSLCLQKFVGVTSKIMNLSSGSDLANKGRELATHFDTNGTPVMIGGGVLAFTLLGVDYNPLTGDIRFLILDPHYTGADNLDVIQGKGWVGWKTVDLFRKDAFYNLCLPQRPLGV